MSYEPTTDSSLRGLELTGSTMDEGQPNNLATESLGEAGPACSYSDYAKMSHDLGMLAALVIPDQPSGG